MAVRELPKDVLKMASGLISPSGWPGHRRQLCTVSPVEVRELPGVEHARQHEGAGVEGARGGGPAYQRRHRAHHRAHPGVEDAVPGALRRSASG